MENEMSGMRIIINEQKKEINASQSPDTIKFNCRHCGWQHILSVETDTLTENIKPQPGSIRPKTNH